MWQEGNTQMWVLTDNPAPSAGELMKDMKGCFLSYSCTSQSFRETNGNIQVSCNSKLPRKTKKDFENCVMEEALTEGLGLHFCN